MSASPSKASRKPLVIVVPEELVRTTPSGEQEVEPGVWFCRIGSTEYRCTISREAVERGPAWTPEQQLPVSHSQAVEVARSVLKRLVTSTTDWLLDEITLQRLLHSVPERWFFVVGFSRETGRQSRNGIMRVCVDFSGQPGTIERVRRR